MQQSQNSVNPDVISQQAIQAKLNVYQAKEEYESILKMYNDNVDALIKVIGMMKSRILELEAQQAEKLQESVATSN